MMLIPVIPRQPDAGTPCRSGQVDCADLGSYMRAGGRGGDGFTGHGLGNGGNLWRSAADAAPLLDVRDGFHCTRPLLPLAGGNSHRTLNGSGTCGIPLPAALADPSTMQSENASIDEFRVFPAGGEHRLRYPLRDGAQMRVMELIAPFFLVIAVAGFSAYAGGPQTPGPECVQLSSVPDDAPLALGLTDPASAKIEPSRAEAACRPALAADPANATLMFLLARALSLGHKHLEAIKYYLDAADRDHAGAMNDLGGVFESGAGVPKNLTTGLVWYERAAEVGHAGAMLHLGQLSEKGVDVPQDFAKARYWYEKAAALGNAVAMNSLADLLRQGRGGEPDPPAAASWYLKAAQRGLPDAMNSLGEFSEGGMGVPQDDHVARSWYKKAADLGHADAMGNLGALLEAGRGGPQDLAAAREWYVKGAALHGRLAMHRLGAMLENGRGALKNLSEAKFWYERAAALEYPPALNDLGRLYLAGIGAPKNYALAKTLFEQAAELGNAEAMNNLGLLYLDGRGVQRDIKLARSWFERAAALDNAKAQENLKRLEHAGLMDGTQVAARRASCVQTCATLHKSYVNSVCDRYSTVAQSDKPERTKCIDMSLSLARHCRDSCREWASTPVADNRCLSCFQTLIACGTGQEPPDGEGNDRPYATDSQGCLAALADCMAKCQEQPASANAENPD